LKSISWDSPFKFLTVDNLVDPDPLARSDQDPDAY
jgi:hypothetical protein